MNVNKHLPDTADSTTGTVDAITAVFLPRIKRLINGMILNIKATGANTVTAPTFTPRAGLPPLPIVKGLNQPLDIGDIIGANHWLQLQYDSTLGKWTLLNPASSSEGFIVNHGGSGLTTNTTSGTEALDSNTTGASNTAAGYKALTANTTGAANTATGANALVANTTGSQNTATGAGSLFSNTTGDYNTATGREALRNNTTGANNTATGVDALRSNTTGSNNTANGMDALYSNTSGLNNTAVGYRALYANLTGSYNIAHGAGALSSNTTGSNNVAIGQTALNSNTIGDDNMALGQSALYANTEGLNNTATGYRAMRYNVTGSYNVANGSGALSANTTGSNNTAIGQTALNANTTGSSNTALGQSALSTAVSYDNISGLGYNAEVTGSNQVQIGDLNTTTYVHGTVQDRSDQRDKADIQDTVLGLEFIKALRPVDFKWDLRDSYRPAAPDLPAKEATEEDIAAYEVAKTAWLEAAKLANLTHDGSHKRSRFHHGVIAQEVAALITSTGVDFGGYQDHTINGGDAVLTIGYDEFIGPLIKAVQQLAADYEAYKLAHP